MKIWCTWRSMIRFTWWKCFMYHYFYMLCDHTVASDCTQRHQMACTGLKMSVIRKRNVPFNSQHVGRMITSIKACFSTTLSQAFNIVSKLVKNIFKFQAKPERFPQMQDKEIHELWQSLIWRKSVDFWTSLSLGGEQSLSPDHAAH